MPVDFLGESGEIVGSRLIGLAFTDVVNALYMAEVEEQLSRHFDALLVEGALDHDLEMVAAAIGDQSPGSNLGVATDAIGTEVSSDALDAASRWLASIAANPAPLLRARAQARLALGAGFWRVLDGETFQVTFEPADPLSHHGRQLPAWDVASRVWLGKFERTFRDSRANWLRQAISRLFSAMSGRSEIHVNGVDSTNFETDDQAPQRIANRLFLALPRTWRLYRAGSILEVLSPVGRVVRVFREVGFEVINDLGMTAKADRAIRSATEVPSVTGDDTKKANRGISYRDPDKPWIEAMHAHALAGTARNILDAANAVVGLEIGGKKLMGPGNPASKVSRLRGLYKSTYGAWPSQM